MRRPHPDRARQHPAVHQMLEDADRVAVDEVHDDGHEQLPETSLARRGPRQRHCEHAEHHDRDRGRNAALELRQVVGSAGLDQGRRRECLAPAREDSPRLYVDADRVLLEPGHRERRFSRQARVAIAVFEHHVPRVAIRAFDLVARTGYQHVLPVRLSDPHEHVRRPAALRTCRLDVDDLISAAELLEPARHEHLALGLPPRLFEQRPPHRSGARRDEQRHRRSHQRAPRHHQEDTAREPPQPDPARSERDDLAVPVETPQADEYRDVECEREKHRKLLHELQGEHLDDEHRGDGPGRRIGEEARESIRPVDQYEHREHRDAGPQHFTGEVALDDQGDPGSRRSGAIGRGRGRSSEEAGDAGSEVRSGMVRCRAGTDGQLPRALTTLPTKDSGTLGPSREGGRVTPGRHVRGSGASTGARGDGIKPPARPSLPRWPPDLPRCSPGGAGPEDRPHEDPNPWSSTPPPPMHPASAPAVSSPEYSKDEIRPRRTVRSTPRAAASSMPLRARHGSAATPASTSGSTRSTG